MHGINNLNIGMPSHFFFYDFKNPLHGGTLVFASMHRQQNNALLGRDLSQNVMVIIALNRILQGINRGIAGHEDPTGTMMLL